MELENGFDIFFIRILTQRRRGAECAEFFRAACGSVLGGGGGAKVRASGYGVFAEVPRGEAFGHRRRPPFLGTDPTIANKIKGLTGSVPNFRSSELELESGELGVGGGAKVRASGYGVFAEVPRGEAFGHRRRPPFLGTDPTIANKIKGLTGSVPNFRVLRGSRP